MNIFSLTCYLRRTIALLALTAVTSNSAVNAAGIGVDNVKVGRDNNSSLNSFVQPQDDALAGAGRDQTLQFGDNLFGSRKDDLLIGGLGVDILVGGRGDDVIVGGLEHFNPANRDRAFGGPGDDIFIWKPGDGSDFFSGDRGLDVVVFGLVGEFDDGEVKFELVNDQQSGRLAVSRQTRLPFVDVTNSPGFCDVIDASTTVDAAEQLKALRLDDLVQFSIRAIADSFESGEQTDDNGLRVTLHLRGVELLICTNRQGGNIEVIDLTSTPARQISLDTLSQPRYGKLVKRLNRMLR